jgi:hypothetical protein
VVRLLDWLDRVFGTIGGWFYGPSHSPAAGLTVLSVLLLATAAVLAWGRGLLGEALGFAALGLGAFVGSAISNNLD